MPEPTISSAHSFRSLFVPWTRHHSMGVFFALLGLLLAWMLQISVLSSWLGSVDAAKIPLAPANALVSAETKVGAGADAKANAALRFSFVGAPAVSATQTIDVRTDNVLGVSLEFDQIPPGTSLNLGWVGTRDRRKPSNLAVKMPASTTPQTIYVPLRGHAAWRDNITQFAVVLIAPRGSPTMTLANAKFVGATPAAATSHATSLWFSDSSLLQAGTVAQRVLPLSLLIVVATLVAFASISILKREAPVSRRAGVAAAAIVLTIASIALSLFGPKAFDFAASLTPWWLASAALLVACFGRYLRLPAATENFYLVEVVSLLLSALSVALGSWYFLWGVAAVIVIHVGFRFAPLFAYAQSALFFLPIIGVGGLVQAVNAKHVVLPDITFADPSSPVASFIHNSAAIVAIAAIVLLARVFWPRTVVIGANRGTAIALWFVALGTLAAFAVRGQTGLNVASMIGTAWMLAPFLIAMFAWLAPTFSAPLITTAEATNHQRTENDLSAIVRQLFDGSAASFDSAIASDRPGSALAPLNRMKEIAPASAITQAAVVRYAIENNKLENARGAYESLMRADANQLSESANVVVLEYANLSDDFATVVERAQRLAPSETRERLIARAHLLAATPSERELARQAAISTLESLAKPNQLAHEIAELHLLNDDWRAAQRALAGSQFTPQSIAGQIYVARLGFRATGGQTNYVDQIQKLATWNNTLGVAQFGMGELLLAQGNAQGARARFVLARKLDATLWAAERRIADIDADANTAASHEVTPALGTLAV